jgi:hypothetical protein
MAIDALAALPVENGSARPLTSATFWTGVKTPRNTNRLDRMQQRPARDRACCKAQVKPADLLDIIS